jgi:hypothetical protein
VLRKDDDLHVEVKDNFEKGGNYENQGIEKLTADSWNIFSG